MTNQEIISKWYSSFNDYIRKLDYFEYEGEEEVILENLGNLNNEFFKTFVEDKRNNQDNNSIEEFEKELNIVIKSFLHSGQYN